jgi:DNA-binding transcriptional ArsR family regulator
MNVHQPSLRSIHRALADPLRIRLYELLVLQPRSAKELAASVGTPPDRLYHHLAQLEEGKLIEVTEYRRLPGGKVERVYAPATVEPANDNPTPAQAALLFNAALEATRADVNAAAAAQEAGEERQLGLGRIGVHLNAQHLNELKAQIEALLVSARDHPDEDGVWTSFLWVAVDRQDRRAAPSHPPKSRKRPGDEHPENHQPKDKE